MSLRSRIQALFGANKPLFPREPIQYEPVGVVRNRIREPRLSAWQEVRSDIILREELAAALDGIEGFSHVLVVFHLHRVPADGSHAISARIGGHGGRDVGVLASRPPLR